MMYHIFKNGWEDKEYIRQRVYGMDEVKAEVAKWTPDEVERVTGRRRTRFTRPPRRWPTTARHLHLVHGRHPAHDRQQQHPRLLCVPAGARQYRRIRRRRQHLPRSRQRAGRDRPRRARRHPARLRPGPGSWGTLGQGLGPGSGHGSRGASTGYDKDGKEYIGEHDEKDKAEHVMNTKGIRSVALDRRVLENNERSPTNVTTCVMFWGHAPNSQTRGPEMKRPWRSSTCWSWSDPSSDRVGRHARSHRRRLSAAGVYAVRDLRIGDGVEPFLQWRDKVIEPLFESCPTHHHVQAGEEARLC